MRWWIAALLMLGMLAGCDDGGPGAADRTPIGAGGAAGGGGTAAIAGAGAAGAAAPVTGGTSGASGAGGSTAVGGSGGSSGTAGGSGSAAGGAGGGSAAGAGGQGGNAAPMRLAITARDVPPGGEDHICVTLALPNAQTVWLASIHATLTTGSHHLIVDRHPVGTPEQREPVQCPPTMGGDSTRLIIAQQADTVVRMPSGTALRVEPRQPVFLQLHYINLGSESADIEGAIELELFDASETAPIEARSLFTGQMAILLPRGEPGLAEFFYVPEAGGGQRAHVFALTSHTHSLGVDSTIERVPDLLAPDTTPVHQSLDWHEPPLTAFEPPLVFDGSDGLRLRCRYVNDTDRDVTFGTAFEDEMCFMWLYYYEAP